jgi:hypothetical protein
MKPKLISSSKQNNIELSVWQNPKNWTQEEVDICIKYYQLQAKKLGMNISRYMKEFE